MHSALSPDYRLVGVMRYAREYSLVTQAAIEPGQLLFVIDGKLTHTASRHSVQVGERQHVDLPGGVGHDEIMDRFFWRYMNHSCDPSARIVGRDVLSARPLAAGAEITFDYCTTEYEMAEPFTCGCGTAGCIGQVRGFRYLPAGRRALLGPWLAPHVVSLAAAAPGAGRAERMP